MIFRLHPLALACLALGTTSALAAPLELQETVITAKGYQAATQDIPQAIEVLEPSATHGTEPLGSVAISSAAAPAPVFSRGKAREAKFGHSK